MKSNINVIAAKFIKTNEMKERYGFWMDDNGDIRLVETFDTIRQLQVNCDDFADVSEEYANVFTVEEIRYAVDINNENTLYGSKPVIEFNKPVTKAVEIEKTEYAEGTRFAIKDWFYDKLVADKFSEGHLLPYRTFYARQILKETEKAFFVSIEEFTKNGWESKYRRDLWIPKFCVNQMA